MATDTTQEESGMIQNMDRLADAIDQFLSAQRVLEEALKALSASVRGIRSTAPQPSSTPPPPEPPKVNLKDIQKATQAVFKAGREKVVLDLLKEMKLKSLSLAPADKYPEILERLRNAL